PAALPQSGGRAGDSGCAERADFAHGNVRAALLALHIRHLDLLRAHRGRALSPADNRARAATLVSRVGLPLDAAAVPDCRSRPHGESVDGAAHSLLARPARHTGRPPRLLRVVGQEQVARGGRRCGPALSLAKLVVEERQRGGELARLPGRWVLYMPDTHFLR